jgi:hypothetical protein
MALEAGLIQESEYFYSPREEEADVHIKDLKAFEALVRADERALAAPTVQEPVACGYDETTGNCTNSPCCYTTPPAQPAPVQEPVGFAVMENPITPPAAQRQWVGLTDDEIIAVNMSTVTKLIDEPIVCDTDHNIIQLGKAIEAKLKEKNT